MSEKKQVRVIPVTADELGEALWEGMKLHMPIGGPDATYSMLPKQARADLARTAAHVVNAALIKINGGVIECKTGGDPS